MEIRIDDLTGPEIAALLSAHLEHGNANSPPESVHALDLDGLRHPDITFWSVWENGGLLGCGALRELSPEHGELKSMHTARQHRGKGVARIMVERYGVDGIRLTGGEPLVRARLPLLVEKLAALGVDLAMTTNGVSLPLVAEELRAAGLRRVNISLDSLQRDRFRELTRRDDLERVLDASRFISDAIGRAPASKGPRPPRRRQANRPRWTPAHPPDRPPPSRG